MQFKVINPYWDSVTNTLVKRNDIITITDEDTERINLLKRRGCIGTGLERMTIQENDNQEKLKTKTIKKTKKTIKKTNKKTISKE